MASRSAPNFSELPPEVQERLKASNPELRGALGGQPETTPSRPDWMNSSPSRPTNPALGERQRTGKPAWQQVQEAYRPPNPYMGAPIQPAGGGSFGSEGNPLFSANDVPEPSTAQRLEDFKQGRAAENAAAKAARPAIHGNDPRAPGGPLHPTQFSAPATAIPERHLNALTNAHHSALGSLLRPGAGISDVLSFARGEHLAPVHNRMAREGLFDSPQAPAPSVPRPRAPGRARPIPLASSIHE